MVDTRNKVPLWAAYLCTTLEEQFFLWGNLYFFSETWNWMTHINYLRQVLYFLYKSIFIKHHFREDAERKKHRLETVGLKFSLSSFYDVKISFLVTLEAYTPWRCLYKKLTVLFSFLLQVYFKYQNLPQISGVGHFMVLKVLSVTFLSDHRLTHNSRVRKKGKLLCESNREFKLILIAIVPKIQMQNQS